MAIGRPGVSGVVAELDCVVEIRKFEPDLAQTPTRLVVEKRALDSHLKKEPVKVRFKFNHELKRQAE